jgi:tRNA(Ile)-lysidine synthase
MVLEKVKGAIKQYQLLKVGERVLLALSGGPDSMALFDIFLTLQEPYQLSLSVAHLNHLLRGKAAEEDACFVQKLARRFKIPCFIEKIDVLALARQEKKSVEEVAREERYQFLFKIAKKIKAQKIATAHHQDDQVETILMRILRGSGPGGLKGILPLRDQIIIRPLLEISREEILAYLKEKKIKFCQDRSNLDESFFRNKIRKKLIPLLEREYQPQIKRNLLHLAKLVSEEDQLLGEIAEKSLSKLILRTTSHQIVLSLPGFLKEPVAIQRKLILGVLEKIKAPHLYFQHLENILRFLKSSDRGTITLPRGFLVEKKQVQEFMVRKGKEVKSVRFSSVPLNIPGTTLLPALRLSLESKILSPPVHFPPPPSIVYLDYDRVNKPLSLRQRKEGDRFIPLGMKGHQKIKDFFINQKIPLERRESIPLLVDQTGKILWVVGLRLSEEVKVIPQTKKVLKIEVKRAFEEY